MTNIDKILLTVVIIIFTLFCSWLNFDYNKRKRDLEERFNLINRHIFETKNKFNEYEQNCQTDRKIIIKKEYCPSKSYKTRHRVRHHWIYKIEYSQEEYRIYFKPNFIDTIDIFLVDKVTFTDLKIGQIIDTFNFNLLRY